MRKLLTHFLIGEFMFFNKQVLSLLLATTAFVSCGNKDSSTKDVSVSSTFTYEYSEEINGFKCTTKKHVFNNIQEYCSALVDEKLNDYCAYEIRKLDFAQKCSASKTTADANQQPQPETDPNPKTIPVQKEPVIIPEPAAVLPNELVIIAHSKTQLNAEISKSTENGDTALISLLTAELEIDSMTSDKIKSLYFLEAEKSVLSVGGISEVGACDNKLIKNFEFRNNKIIFTILSTESRDVEKGFACTVLLSKILFEGFSIEFKKVPTKRIILSNSDILETVILKVQVK